MMRKNLTREADRLGEDNRLLWVGLIISVIFIAAMIAFGD